MKNKKILLANLVKKCGGLIIEHTIDGTQKIEFSMPAFMKFCEELKILIKEHNDAS